MVQYSSKSPLHLQNDLTTQTTVYFLYRAIIAPTEDAISNILCWIFMIVLLQLIL